MALRPSNALSRWIRSGQEGRRRTSPEIAADRSDPEEAARALARWAPQPRRDTTRSSRASRRGRRATSRSGALSARGRGVLRQQVGVARSRASGGRGRAGTVEAVAWNRSGKKEGYDKRSGRSGTRPGHGFRDRQAEVLLLRCRDHDVRAAKPAAYSARTRRSRSERSVAEALARLEERFGDELAVLAQQRRRNWRRARRPGEGPEEGGAFLSNSHRCSRG